MDLPIVAMEIRNGGTMRQTPHSDQRVGDLVKVLGQACLLMHLSFLGLGFLVS